MSNKVSSNSNTLTIQETIQAKTNLSKNSIKSISDEGLNYMMEMLEQGVSGTSLANLFEEYINKFQEVEKNVIKAKIEEEIKKKNFNEEIVEKGDKLVYHKFVVVGELKYSVESKDFKSKRQCVTWLRLKKINIKV